MGYRPTERDLYVAKNSNYGEYWDRMDEQMRTPPSLEVFTYGLAKASGYMKRGVTGAEYHKWLIEWAQTNPTSMKEAP